MTLERNIPPMRQSPTIIRRTSWPFLFAVSLLVLACPACGEEESTEESPSSGLVALNEISCHGRDWVEIVNITAAAIDIGLWRIADSLTKDGRQFALPSGTEIQPEEHLVIRRQKDLEEGFAFGLKCGEESVYLLDSEGGIVDQVEIGNAPYGGTWGRLPDVTGLWRETYPTENDPNEAPTSASY
ncbi:MAG: lamin tail domain-containing protein [Myxococcales bacterium]|nr:MAG: lamin tail domain-containing protein [Myxococcales bacterium]